MLERYDPFRATVPLRQAIDRLFEETLELMRPWSFGLLARFGFDGGYFMPVNIYHTADELVYQFIIPGVRPEDIQVELTGDTLTVKAEIKSLNGQQVDWIRCEWQPGVYSRTLTLPFPVQADRAEAKYEHGVLTLRLPKAEEVRPKHIRVQAVSA